MAKKSSKKTSSVSVNFEGVEAGGRSLPDGQYSLEVEGVPELKTSAESGNQYISWVFKVTEGKYKNRKVWHNTSLQPQALFNLRNLLEAMGIEVEDASMDLELDEFEGSEVGAIVVNEKYEGKDRPRISEFIPTEDVESTDDDEEEEEEEEDDEPKPKKSSSKTAAKAPVKGKKKVEEEDEDEDEDEDEEEEEPAPKKSSKKAPPAKTSSKKKPVKEEEEDEDEDEEEEEEEPAPKKTIKKTTKKAPAFKAGQKVTFEDDGEELTGKIVELNDEVATVKVGKDHYEIELSDLTAA